MGDIAEAIIDGLFCQECGTVIDGDEPGYPRNCLGCQPKSVIKRNIRAKKQKYPCAICGKVIAEIGLPQHMRDKHSESRQAMAKKISDLQTQLDDLSSAVKELDNYGVFGPCYDDGKTGVIDVEGDFYDLSREQYEALAKAIKPTGGNES